LFFVGKTLNASTLMGAMESLQREVIPDYNLPDATPEYRLGLTQSLLYKVSIHKIPHHHISLASFSPICNFVSVAY